MARGQSPTARTKAWCRKLGMIEGTVEMRIAIPGVAFQPLRDFCGFADVIAYDAMRTVAIQATSGTNAASRVTKILAEPKAYIWANGLGRLIWVVTWKKYAEAEDRRWWRETVVEIVPHDFTAEVIDQANALVAAAGVAV